VDPDEGDTNSQAPPLEVVADAVKLKDPPDPALVTETVWELGFKPENCNDCGVAAKVGIFPGDTVSVTGTT
jgi:hypothetical protein